MIFVTVDGMIPKLISFSVLLIWAPILFLLKESNMEWRFLMAIVAFILAVVGGIPMLMNKLGLVGWRSIRLRTFGRKTFWKVKHTSFMVGILLCASVASIAVWSFRLTVLGEFGFFFLYAPIAVLSQVVLEYSLIEIVNRGEKM